MTCPLRVDNRVGVLRQWHSLFTWDMVDSHLFINCSFPVILRGGQADDGWHVGCWNYWACRRTFPEAVSCTRRDFRSRRHWRLNAAHTAVYLLVSETNWLWATEWEQIPSKLHSKNIYTHYKLTQFWIQFSIIEWILSLSLERTGCFSH